MSTSQEAKRGRAGNAASRNKQPQTTAKISRKELEKRLQVVEGDLLAWITQYRTLQADNSRLGEANRDRTNALDASLMENDVAVEKIKDLEGQLQTAGDRITFLLLRVDQLNKMIMAMAQVTTGTGTASKPIRQDTPIAPKFDLFGYLESIDRL
ncbi:MAG: hypothetical protein A3G52_02725 [Candidatus Taylorbacteria bacterium RIFCSPLOWO2_12_FULL_43_20]|uniref:Uncharacterized protein n=1 Tax=Candidatus Taylorbacteria bacterium RIFCSPLOWO2_12_FULL_43_20 TaxID=1802332 RepID=A0A1G2NZN7_9BACT|nr:MAG: hypothetical protein A2825_02905 [Candidatus Taylorbacteria bacterium RIFCSPHIGHO2_01_FULL_43_120]OHA23638.1 MAG: hypothetical protein A3B98_03220 [Candidatus Taylorbacteria bacterium RIFCSPHIGHO2_02_FULL_43_55]OHA28113.1 MAG: hypothetical protein A3E92_00210 [Candidatus Taylorbacteria bacterium RIFCSPHIGHO2_12_FULL_42_34]OHA32326.1 MAG: hypothetical protein A3B09_03130 [Candidatus Taylorbacteria bacterium RIFCSPLOWO2_01_FULL_43_83]OHA37663.1 MAG: hypothetical protein A3H58_03250 [Candi